MKHLRLYESAPGDMQFSSDLDGVDIEVEGMPAEWSDRGLSISGGRIKWTLSMNVNKRGIEWFSTSVPQLVLFGNFDDDDEIEFELQNVDTELYNITESLYPTFIKLDMSDSSDSSGWDVKTYFGNT